jgi:hypothetical protein
MALYPSGDIEFNLSVRISISPQHALPGISGILPEKSERLTKTDCQKTQMKGLADFISHFINSINQKPPSRWPSLPAAHTSQHHYVRLDAAMNSRS